MLEVEGVDRISKTVAVFEVVVVVSFLVSRFIDSPLPPLYYGIIPSSFFLEGIHYAERMAIVKTSNYIDTLPTAILHSEICQGLI